MTEIIERFEFPLIPSIDIDVHYRVSVGGCIVCRCDNLANAREVAYKQAKSRLKSLIDTSRDTLEKATEADKKLGSDTFYVGRFVTFARAN